MARTPARSSSAPKTSKTTKPTRVASSAKPAKPAKPTKTTKTTKATTPAKPTKGSTSKPVKVTKSKAPRLPSEGSSIFGVKKKKAIPYDFVLDELDELGPETRAMFGATAVYVGDRIVLILRDKDDSDSGVWLATSHEHHESLQEEFPSMRSIAIFGTKVTGWQVLPSSARDFESSVLRACELVRRGDARIGKVPERKRRAQKG